MGSKKPNPPPTRAPHSITSPPPPLPSESACEYVTRTGYCAQHRDDLEKLIKASVAALEHLDELRDAWSRGVISEHDGLGGRRSNRNAEVESNLRRALESIGRKD